MKQLQFKDHDIDMFITVSNDSLRVIVGMLNVRVALNTLDFDDEKCSVSSYIDFNLSLEQENYQLVKQTVIDELALAIEQYQTK